MTVSADGLPTWQVNGVVWAQAISGNTVFVVGSFTKARPPGTSAGNAAEISAPNVFAYDIRTGLPAYSIGGDYVAFPYGLDAQGTAVAVSPDGGTVYMGGDFSYAFKISTPAVHLGHGHIVAFSVATGAILSGFNASASARVTTISTTPSAVYFGGEFGAADGVGRSHAAAVDPADGSLLPWAPTTDDAVLALVVTPDGDRVVLGGRFSSIDGATAEGMGMVDSSTGATSLRWDANKTIRNWGTTGAIYALRTDGTNIYGTAYKYGTADSGSFNFEGTFVANPANGALIVVNDCHGDTYDVLPLGAVMYTASHAHSCQAIGAFKDTKPNQANRWALAYTTTQGGTCTNVGPDDYGWNYNGWPCSTLLAWAPTLTPGTYTKQNQAAWSLAGNSDYISYGGEFLNVNGVPQQGLVRFASVAKAPNKTGPVYSSVQTPLAYPTGPGELTVLWPAAYDRDNGTLTYSLYRDTGTTPIWTGTQDSQFWSEPTIGYPDAGLTVGSTHRYRFSVADSFGNTSTSSFSQPVVVSGSATATFVRDTFQREAIWSWSTADIGGDWSTSTRSAFAVSNGKGVLTPPTVGPSATQTAYLGSVASTTSDVAVDIGVDEAPTGDGDYAIVLGRRVSGGNDYRLLVRLLPSSEVALTLQKTVGGSSTAIPGGASETIIPDVSWWDSSSSSIVPVRVRLQVSGIGGGTTRIRARAWSPTAPEPSSWDVSTNDTTGSLQGGGTIGVGGFLSATSTNAPTSFFFDRLLVTAAQRVLTSTKGFGPGGNFTFADLTGLDGLQHLDLHGSNFTGARLKGLDLTGVNVTGSDFTSADLSNANLTGAALTGVDLTGANLSGATLTGVTSGGITGVPLALPAGWSIVHGYLVGPRANLHGADLHGQNLAGLNLSGATLTGANLRGANISGTNFTSADLTGASIDGTTTGTATWTSAICADGKAVTKHNHGSCQQPLDTTPPTAAMTAPTARFSAALKYTVAWTGSDPGNAVAYYALRVSRGKVAGGSMSAYSGIGSRITSRAVVATGLLGYRYCYEVQSIDTALNPSGWSAPRCINMPSDDRSFTASKGWARGKARGWLASTYSRTTGKGVSLTGARNVSVTQVGIIATACKTCGSVSVYVGSTRVGSISLYSAKTVARRLFLLKPFAPRAGAIKIVVTSRKKTVSIDAVVQATG